MVRGQGAHDFDTADDLTWYAGIGAMVVEEKGFTLALSARFFGDTKDQDYFLGQRLGDTLSTNVYVGPHAVATIGKNLTADVGLDLPMRQENSGVSSTSNWRMQAGLKLAILSGGGSGVRCEVVEPRGLEPLTSSMPLRRSTN